MIKKSDKYAWMPTVRYPETSWKNFAALVYAIVADLLGLRWMMMMGSGSNYFDIIKLFVPAIFFSCHGRIVASYLVHEACHGNIFVEQWANKSLGIICLWFAGCPYANFDHVRFMHDAHHKDRADSVEFDYRDFVNQQHVAIRTLILNLEWYFVPVIETIMHVRAALYPIFASEGGTCTLSRRRSAWIGTPVAMFFHIYLWQQGVLLPHVISGALLLHFLSMSDSFHHTYEAFMMKDYKPGPGDRTAKFEEENTYSNVISTSFPWLNTLVLNFGYHNAHHKKPMVPWYALPDYHDKLYGGLLTEASMKQVLPVQDVLRAWVIHRVRRVLEEDYGVVHPPGTPGRADDFIGTLGVSFLTV